MDIRGPAFHGLVDEAIDQSDDGGIIAATEQVSSFGYVVNQALESATAGDGGFDIPG